MKMSLFIWGGPRQHYGPTNGRETTHGELKGLDKTQYLVDRASDEQITHRGLSGRALRIDHWQTARVEHGLGPCPQSSLHARAQRRQKPDVQIGPEHTRGQGGASTSRRSRSQYA